MTHLQYLYYYKGLYSHEQLDQPVCLIYYCASIKMIKEVLVGIMENEQHWSNE